MGMLISRHKDRHKPKIEQVEVEEPEIEQVEEHPEELDIEQENVKEPEKKAGAKNGKTGDAGKQ